MPRLYQGGANGGQFESQPLRLSLAWRDGDTVLFLVTKLCLVTRFPEALLPVMNSEAESRRAGMCSQAELGNKVRTALETIDLLQQ